MARQSPSQLPVAQLAPQQPITTGQAIKSLVSKEEYASRFREVLGERAPQFIASMIAVGNTLPPGTEPRSVMAAAMTAACLDLPLDKGLGFAHIVPYKGVAQFQIGYLGLIQLALRTGQYKKMNASAINAEAYKGRDEVGDPIIAWDAVDDTKEPVGYAFSFQMVNGFTKTVYWPKKKIINHAARYSMAFKMDRKDSPWFTNFDAMALKTVIKDGIRHWGIMSVQMQQALATESGDVLKADVTTGTVETVVEELQAAASTRAIPDTDEKVEEEIPGLETSPPAQPKQESKPSDSAPPPAKENPEGSDEAGWARKRLCELMDESKVTFDQLRNYGEQLGHLDDPASCGSVDEIPIKIVNMYIKAWKTIAKSIKTK